MLFVLKTAPVLIQMMYTFISIVHLVNKRFVFLASAFLITTCLKNSFHLTVIL